jgi:hypothetical protein
MKKNFLVGVLSFLFLVSTVIGAGAVTLVWNTPDSGVPEGYIVSWGTSTGNYNTNSAAIDSGDCVAGTNTDGSTYNCKLDVGSTFTEGTPYFFAAKAWNWAADGVSKLESAWSNEVQYVNQGGGGQQGVPPGVPKTVRLQK